MRATCVESWCISAIHVLSGEPRLGDLLAPLATFDPDFGLRDWPDLERRPLHSEVVKTATGATFGKHYGGRVNTAVLFSRSPK